MKFEIKNRWTNAVHVTAEIECAADAIHSIKLGAAAKWAVASHANLTGAYLTDANLTGAEWNGVKIKRAPIQIYGLSYPVTIIGSHMQIGCEFHSIEDWSSFDDGRIARMDGVNSRRFWRDWKDALLTIAAANGMTAATDEQPSDLEAV